MKKSVRILSVLLVAIMLCMTFAVSASAATSSKLTLKSTKDEFIFSLFKLADVNTTTGVFTVNDALNSDIKTQVKTSLSAVKITATDLEKKSADLADYIDSAIVGKSSSDQAALLGGVVDKFDVTADNYSKEFTTLADGIYYIVALNGDTPDNVTRNQGSIVTLPEYNRDFDPEDPSTRWKTDVVIDLEPKVSSDSVEVTKTIVPSDNYKTSTNKDAAITDETTPVTFELRASVVGSTEQPLQSYVIGDNMDDGLTYVASQTPVIKLVKEGADDYVLTADQYNFNDETPTYTDGTNTYSYTFAFELDESVFASTAKFNDISFYEYDAVVVQYNAVINENIEVIKAENNTDYLLYKNNAGSLTQVNGNTVEVYTLAVDISKYDASVYDAKATDKTFLAGAVFGLYAEDGTLVAKANSTETGADKFYALDANNEITKNEYNVKVGSYTIRELVAPDGYTLNTTVIPVTISATVEKGSITPVDTDGYFSYECGNTPIVLPATGGAGTIMFTIVGATLITIAGVLFFVVMRKKNTTK